MTKAEGAVEVEATSRVAVRGKASEATEGGRGAAVTPGEEMGEPAADVGVLQVEDELAAGEEPSSSLSES